MNSHSVILLINWVFWGMLATSCRTRTVVVEHTLRDTLQIVQKQRDSIYIHDSTRVEVVTKGDTVYWKEIKWKTKEKIVEKHDTVRHVVRDSIPVPYEVERKVTVKDRVNNALKLLGVVLLTFVFTWIYLRRK